MSHAALLSTLVAGAAFFFLGLAPIEATAQTLRCRNDLVKLGDTRTAVQRKCGEPASRDPSCRTVRTALANGRGTRARPDLPCVHIEEWTYLFGYGQPVTTLSFEEGRLQRIEYGDRQ